MKRHIILLAGLALGVYPAGAVTLYSGVDLGNATGVGTNTTNAYNSFTSVLTGFNAVADTDTLESIALGEAVNIGSAAGVTITASCSSCDFSGTFSIKSGVQNTADGQNGYNTSSGGSHFYQVAGAEVGGTSQNTVLTLTFSSPIQVFGVFLTDIQSSLAVTTVTFNDGSPESFVLPTSGDATGCPASCSTAGSQFFGFVTNGTVTTVTFTTVQTHAGNNSARDIFGLDDLTIGSIATPEPGTFVLLGGALAGLGALRLRRR